MPTPEAQPTEGNSSGTEREDTMATLGRSLKSPSYLTRAGRPGLVRALSNSSELSVASADSGRDNDEQHMDFIMSGPNTPLGERTQQDAMTSAPSESKPRAPRAEPPGAALTLKPIESSTIQSARLDRSRPIAIELPHIRSSNSAQNYTPPEPLSARGDKPGGYFPLHEDPKARVHRFQPAAKKSRQPHPVLHLPPESKSPVQKSTSQPITMPESVNSMSSNTPVMAYNPSGVLDTSLPLGKYYPSNYEKMHRPALSSQSSAQQGIRPPPAVGPPSSVKSDSQLLARPTASNNDSEVKRKLQQYQRDMIAQARLAANQVLGDGGAQSGTPLPPATVTLNGVPLRSLHHYGMTSAHKPISPRLLPLGSPGPVTPMDLEGGDGGYLDRGRASVPLGESEEIARALRAEAAFMRREGTTSPAVEAGPQAFF